jgi:hypothetical protein
MEPARGGPVGTTEGGGGGVGGDAEELGGAVAIERWHQTGSDGE